jgi:hypothetical protein
MSGTTLSALFLSLAMLSIPAISQDLPTFPGAPGCGHSNAKFAVSTDAGQHPTSPEAGKALVYVIQDDSNFNSFPKPTIRAGLDGDWVGATHGNSYLYFSVDPGVHHICASWQSAVILMKGRMTAAAHFTAEAGGVYYFKVKDTFVSTQFSSLTDVTFAPLDSDEGQILASQYSLSTSHRKRQRGGGSTD